MLCLFSNLALGTRFRYTDAGKIGEKRLWVKIGANTIAEWDELQKTDNWVGQQICLFTDTFDTDVYVNVL
jgi:hypothetical protein